MNVGVLPLRRSILSSSLVSLLMTSFGVQYPLSAYKSATPLSLLQYF